MATINPASPTPCPPDSFSSMASTLASVLQQELAPLRDQIATLQAEVTRLNADHEPYPDTPHVSPRGLPIIEDKTDERNPMKTSNTFHYLRAMGAADDSSLAEIPRIQSHTRLNSSGDFVESTAGLSNTHRSSISSVQVENDVMDRRQGMSFTEIGNREKRDVFQLGAVRRNMRHLDYADLLLTKEALALAQRFMEVSHKRMCERVSAGAFCVMAPVFHHRSRAGSCFPAIHSFTHEHTFARAACCDHAQSTAAPFVH